MINYWFGFFLIISFSLIVTKENDARVWVIYVHCSGEDFFLIK